MPHIEWSADLEIGISVIDGQHRRIVDYINTLTDIAQQPNREITGAVIDDLIDYTYSHFEFEEALMEEAGYEPVAVHCRTHEAFREQINAFKKRFKAGEEITEDLAELLRTWLISHIVREDKHYAPLVQEKLPGIERKDQGSWLGNTLKRFFSG